MTTPIDPVRLSKTMSYLLRHRPDVGGLQPDADGWVPLEALVEAVGKLMHRSISASEVRGMLDASRVKRFEATDTSIRAVAERRKRPRVYPPDILYHATGADSIEKAAVSGQIRGTGRRPLYLSGQEQAAWRVAHTRHGEAPRVLYVDTTRARRHGVRFFKNKRTGLFTTERLPLADVLNLQPHFGEQQSAGGVPVSMAEDGSPRLALIKVTRRSGVTWEVAKGKLEFGETPASAGVREVREEMGIESDLLITHYVGLIRYGFLAPGGLPRLKSVYLYLMKTVDGSIPTFTPREEEGIGDVQWFTPEDACQAVTHSSLRPIMQTVREIVEAEFAKKSQQISDASSLPDEVNTSG